MNANTHSAPETRAETNEFNGAVGEFIDAFEGFRERSDERLAAIEKRMGGEGGEDRLETLGRALAEQEKRLERLTLKQSRPPLGGGTERADERPSEHRSAFEAYVRGGDEQRLRRLEEKAMNGLTGADGGFLVPPETETEIGRRLASISPIRSVASVRTVSSAVLKKPFATGGAQTGWVSEVATRPRTDAPVLAELSFPTMELYAMPAASAALLDDAAVDIDRWIGEEVEQAFAAQEGAAFVNGDGVAKPRGFMTYPTVHEADWSWGRIGTVPTGAAGAFKEGAGASDCLIDLIYALKAGYRQNASFVMNRRTQSTIRKLKDADGNYLWAPPAGAGGRATLMGFPVVEAEEMPDIAPGANAIAFGDFQRFYLVVDRQGVRVLRDPYSAKPYVLFYTTKRVGGGVQDFDAAKFLSFAV